MRCLTTMLTVALALGATTAQAATAVANTAVANTIASPMVYGGGGYSGNNYHWAYDDNAVTPLQSYGYGVARMFQAGGQYNANSAQAAIDYAYAARERMKNIKIWEETYFDMRRMNREYRAAERPPQATAADMARYAQMERPRRLGPSDLDAVTGAITWPILLRLPDLAADRSALERLFAQRAAAGSLDVDQYLKVFQMTAQMLDDLRGRIRDLPADDYMTARRFLESLGNEAQTGTHDGNGDGHDGTPLRRVG